MLRSFGDTYRTADIRQSMARVRELLRSTKEQAQTLTVNADDLRHIYYMAEVGCRRYGINNHESGGNR